MTDNQVIKFHDQTTFSDRSLGTFGDCFRACIATVLQIQPEQLPHPIAKGGGWNGAFWPALRSLGWIVRTIEHDGSPFAGDMCCNGGYEIPRIVMAAGKSPRGDFLHSVVWDRTVGRMVHDPHPSRAGLVSISHIDFLAAYLEDTPND